MKKSRWFTATATRRGYVSAGEVFADFTAALRWCAFYAAHGWRTSLVSTPRR